LRVRSTRRVAALRRGDLCTDVPQPPGCLGFVYGVAGSKWVTQTFWDTEEHIEDAEASALYRDVVSRPRRDTLTRPTTG